MLNINLLPWRETNYRKMKQQFIKELLLALTLTAAFVVLTYCYYYCIIQQHVRRNIVLTKDLKTLAKPLQEIKALQQAVQADSVLLRSLEGLQQQKRLTQALLHELIQVVPQGLYLTKVAKKDHTMVLWGYALSQVEVLSLIRNIETYDPSQHPRVTEIKHSTKTAGSVFCLQVNVRGVS